MLFSRLGKLLPQKRPDNRAPIYRIDVAEKDGKWHFCIFDHVGCIASSKFAYDDRVDAYRAGEDWCSAYLAVR